MSLENLVIISLIIQTIIDLSLLLKIEGIKYKLEKGI